jgi:N-methylhydantoinase B/oxoprolinase/acetone carboxylase alpha subunit
MEASDFQQREALRKFFKPEDEAKAAERQEDLDLARAQQIVDRRAYIKGLDQERDRTLNGMRDEIKAMRDQHQAEQQARNKGYDEELARRLRERQKAIDLAREQSEWAKDFDKEQEQRWDNPDVPRRGK